MKSLFSLGIVAAVLTVGSIAMAYPTLNGETGIVALPNALTANAGSVVGAADVLFDYDNTLKARALFGMSDRTEFGASLSTGIVDGISASAKYRFTDDHARFNLAGGGSLTLANHSDTAVDLYIVGTQAVSVGSESHPLLLSLGLHFFNLNSDNTLRPFIGAQLPLGHHTELGAEYQLKKGDLFKEPLTSVVLRHSFTRIWAAQVGISNATGFGSTADYRPFIGAQYTFKQSR
jgi:hypothetical protein